MKCHNEIHFISLFILIFKHLCKAHPQHNVLIFEPADVSVVKKNLLGVMLGCALAFGSDLQVQAEEVQSRIGKLSYSVDYPTPETIEKLKDELIFQSAVQTYLWGYPPNQAANRENKLQPKATEGPGLLDQCLNLSRSKYVDSKSGINPNAESLESTFLPVDGWLHHRQAGLRSSIAEARPLWRPIL